MQHWQKLEKIVLVNISSDGIVSYHFEVQLSAQQFDTDVADHLQVMYALCSGGVIRLGPPLIM